MLSLYQIWLSYNYELGNVKICPKDRDCQEDDDLKGESYRGHTAVTKSGRQCQRWDTQSPNKHIYSPTKYSTNDLLNMARLYHKLGALDSQTFICRASRGRKIVRHIEGHNINRITIYVILHINLFFGEKESNPGNGEVLLLEVRYCRGLTVQRI